MPELHHWQPKQMPHEEPGQQTVTETLLWERREITEMRKEGKEIGKKKKKSQWISALCMIGSFFFFPSWAQTLLCRCILVERHFLYLLCISVFRHLTNTIVRFTTGYPEVKVTAGLTAHRMDRASCFTFTLWIEFIGILNYAGCLHGDVGGGGKSWAFKAFSYYKPHSATNTNTHKSVFLSLSPLT